MLLAVARPVGAQTSNPTPPPPPSWTPPPVNATPAPSPTSPPTATPTPPVAKPLIKKVEVLHKVKGHWKATKTVHRNETVRFVLQWGTGSGTRIQPTSGWLTVVQGKKTILQSQKRNKKIQKSGTFHWDIKVTSKVPTGKLVAQFVVTTGPTAQKSVKFSVIA